MDKFFVFILILFLLVDGNGQETKPTTPLANSGQATDTVWATGTCVIEQSEMPLIKGVRIGLTYDEVKAVYPEIETNEWFQKKYQKDKSGLFSLSAKEISNSEISKDLRQIDLNFKDDKIFILSFVFKPKRWKSVSEMTDNLSQIFEVSNNFWTIYNQASVQMDCKDFTVYGNHLIVNGVAMNSMSVHPK